LKKFLKAVRLDDSDSELYATPSQSACDDAEWVCSGGFAVCDLGDRCSPRCYCDSSFLSISRRARSTLAEVVEVEDGDIEIFKDALTQHLLFEWKAPDYENARRVAEEEINYTLELCETFSKEVWISVKRAPGADGAIDEKYDLYERLMIGSHKV
jgi:Family of unknown function (DUF6505)